MCTTRNLYALTYILGSDFRSSQPEPVFIDCNYTISISITSYCMYLTRNDIPNMLRCDTVPWKCSSGARSESARLFGTLIYDKS